MESYIKERALVEADYLLRTKGTIRQTAKFFGISKSTVHLDLSKRLKMINESIFSSVKIILNQNFEERHIRGGNSTKNKFLKLKK